jgi:hypothetical protein
MKIVLSRWFIISFLLLLLAHNYEGLADNNDLLATDVLSILTDKCFDTVHLPGWWSYVWCFRDEVRQIHYDQSIIETNNLIGKFMEQESSLHKEIYRRNISDCQSASGQPLIRRTEVAISCCRDSVHSSDMYHKFEPKVEFGTYIESVTERLPCMYSMLVCSDLVCPPVMVSISTAGGVSTPVDIGHYRRLNKDAEEDLLIEDTEDAAPDFVEFIVDQINHVSDVGSNPFLSKVEQSAHLDRVRAMFHHGYDMYMQHAQPEVT